MSRAILPLIPYTSIACCLAQGQLYFYGPGGSRKVGNFIHSCVAEVKGFFFFLFTTTARLALGVHQASYPVGAADSFPRSKAATV
jgi:hypothetical protein